MESLSYLPDKSKCVQKDRLLEIKRERDVYKTHRTNIEKFELLNSFDYKAQFLNFSEDLVEIGRPHELPDFEKERIRQAAEKLIPWKKGPYSLFGMEIDAEWRSDFKWQRIKAAGIELKGKRILDVGCNNGYFMWRMLAEGPEFVLGIDPVLACWQQFQFLQNFARVPSLHFELFGVEHVSMFKDFFHTIFSMGIIYHHRHPLEQLLALNQALCPGGELIIETIGIPGDESVALFPQGRYAQMNNVWFVPTLSCLRHWLERTNFVEIEEVSCTLLSTDEQRSTSWSKAPSLSDFLDPIDKTKTREGHPAPWRFCLKAKKKC